jgi:hypothetical protein
MSDTDDSEDLTQGWKAIEAAITPLYPGQEPAHFGTIIRFSMGGNDPLDGISAYRATKPQPHWHFVTFGMSELYEKESENKEVSGWGFEFTFRLARDASEPADAQPPMWALNFLQNLARYVFETGNVFEPGHHMDLNGPIALEQETAITATLFARDPQLRPITTPNGKMQFVQILGITADELQAARAWDTTKFLSVMASVDPMLITDLDRKSILADATVAKRVEQGTRADGSSTSAVYVDNIRWQEHGDGSLELTIGASAVDSLKMMLIGRTPFGRNFGFQSRTGVVEFRPGDAVNWQAKDTDLTLTLPAAAAIDLAGRLQVKQGVYPLGERIVVRVVPSRIKDTDGNVVATIGE